MAETEAGLILARRWTAGDCQRLECFPQEPAAEGFDWIHADRTMGETRAWLEGWSGLPGAAIEALFEEDTRPRIEEFPGGFLMILRGVHLTPEWQPDELISVRMWIDARRLITLRGKRVKAPAQLEERIAQGFGPGDVGALVVELCILLTDNLADLVEDIGEILGQLEEAAIDDELVAQRDRLAHTRRRIVALRRHIAPQQYALQRLRQLGGTLVAGVADRLRELENRSTRLQEELHQLAERGQLLQGEVGHALNEQVEQRMRLLTLLGGIFLPLSFITGLLGINVGGMPGVDDDSAFFWVCMGLGGVLALQLLWLRWKRWL